MITENDAFKLKDDTIAPKHIIEILYPNCGQDLSQPKQNVATKSSGSTWTIV
jgi:hypothetical protein